MTTNPVACETSDSVEDVGRLMREKGVGFVVVLDAGKVVGIVTDRQIVTECIARGLVPDGTAVEQIMTSNPAMVTLDDTIFTVIDTLRSAGVVRRVPVVNAKRELLGVVSISDIAVIAKDLVDAVLLEDTRHALSEVKLASGGKQVQKEIRSPHAGAELPPRSFEPVTRSSVPALGERSASRAAR